jgi:hypothetical protein
VSGGCSARPICIGKVNEPNLMRPTVADATSPIWKASRNRKEADETHGMNTNARSTKHLTSDIKRSKVRLLGERSRFKLVGQLLTGLAPWI